MILLYLITILINLNIYYTLAKSIEKKFIDQ